MKMPNEINSKMLATCGINCATCYKHVRTKNVCNGCKIRDEILSHSCRNCAINECANSKGHEYCFQCNEYPCKLIKPLINRYKSVHKVMLIENSNFIKEHGLSAFMQKEKERYACKKCGGVIDRHYGKCSECKE